MKILALPGSLRPASSSNVILKHLIGMFRSHVEITLFEEVGNLPHFNDSNAVNESVSKFRNQILNADGIVICQPEYAYGVAGSLKNALDWSVGTGDFVDKPVALITAATGGENAHAAMLLTLGAMNSIIVKGATLVVSFVKAKVNPDGSLKDLQTADQLQSVVDALVQHIEVRKKSLQS